MKKTVSLAIAVGVGWSAVAVKLDAATNVTLTTLHTFTKTDGEAPEAGLVFGTNGMLYGTTFVGGTSTNPDCILGCGTVFRISTAGAFTSLHSFTGPDGSLPVAELVSASDGNLYGTTSDGGFGGLGTIFRITPSGVLTQIVSLFDSPLAPAVPESPLIEGQDGGFYGSAKSGGPSSPGSVYRVDANGVLAVFGGVDEPKGGLVQDSNGLLYGTTEFGGVSINCKGGCGTVFSMTTNGTVNTLHSFDGADGSDPLCTLVLDDFGNLYGTTKSGGVSNDGTVFLITTNGALTTLHSFTGPDGKQPSAGLIFGTDGKLYGTTASGGSVLPIGTVFQITTNGDFTKLISFGLTNGATPVARLVQGPDGAFYGTTQGGGTGMNPAGTVFKLTVPMNSLWSGAGDLGGGWKWLAWFGYFNTNADPWIYHNEHRWLYPVGTDTSSIFFWDPAMKGGSWWWTLASTYPYLYRFSDSNWLWYQKDSTNPRWFYNLTAAKWESW